MIIPLLPYPHAPLNTGLAPKILFPQMSIFCPPQRPNAIEDAELDEEGGVGLRLNMHSRFSKSELVALEPRLQEPAHFGAS